MTSLATVGAWDPQALWAAADALRAEQEALIDGRDGLERAAPPPTWTGVAAERAATRCREQANAIEETAERVRALAAACDAAAEEIAAAQSELDSFTTTARRRGFAVDDDGRVTATLWSRLRDGLDVAEWFDGEDDTVELTAGIGRAIARAVEADRTLRAELHRHAPHLPESRPAPTTSPPPAGSPREAADWWHDLTEWEQQRIIADHPEWIGNLDGIPAAARDAANRSLIDDHVAALEAERDRISAAVAERWEEARTTGDARSRALAEYSYRRELEQALRTTNGKLDGLAEVATLLERTDTAGDPRQLLTLDISDPNQLLAAVAVGDVDAADHVAVFTPGMNTTVASSLSHHDDSMSRLQQEALTQLAAAGREESVAAVAWLGYEAPQGLVQAISRSRADAGAESLASFFDGIAASRADDPHVTALGHSYGSTTTGLALQRTSVADDAVFFGSPGLGTDDIGDLNVPDGHSYVLENTWDAVADTGVFGTDPNQLDGVHNLETGEATIDGRVYHGSTGHGTAGPDDTDAYLGRDTTNLYNMGAVVADRSELVYGDNSGFGDAFSRGLRAPAEHPWPILPMGM